jgi:hypothetical protein
LSQPGATLGGDGSASNSSRASGKRALVTRDAEEPNRGPGRLDLVAEHAEAGVCHG